MKKLSELAAKIGVRVSELTTKTSDEDAVLIAKMILLGADKSSAKYDHLKKTFIAINSENNF